MSTISHILGKWQSLDVRSIAVNIVSNHTNDFVEIQKNQLWAGKNAEGTDLTPSIFEDPFFKGNKAWAQWWSDFKDTQHQRSDNAAFGIRKKGTPNLIFTTGAIVWDTIHLVVSGDRFYIAAELGIQNELESKYGDIFGLNPQGAKYAIETFFKQELFETIYKHLSV